MSNVLIRNVPPDDLEQIRSAAAERGTSLQNYLLDTIHAQASYLRRQEALARTEQRLRSREEAPGDERTAVLDAVQAAHDARATELGSRSRQ